MIMFMVGKKIFRLFDWLLVWVTSFQVAFQVRVDALALRTRKYLLFMDKRWDFIFWRGMLIPGTCAVAGKFRTGNIVDHVFLNFLDIGLRGWWHAQSTSDWGGAGKVEGVLTRC